MINKSRRKILNTILLILLLICTLSCFNVVFSSLNYNAAAFYKPKKQAIDIPSDLNFIDDDKKAFLSYCSTLYGINKTYTIDSKSYYYYGTIQGRRLYRLNATYIPFENIYNETDIGGYVFTSSRLYKPYDIGLYIIDSNGVYTLQKAYNSGLINIRQVYELYYSKSKS